MTERTIEVEVAYAREQQQALLTVKGNAGLTVNEAITRSGLLSRFPEINLDINKVGIYGKPTTLDQTLSNGDRVEIYTPLIADPKQANRKKRPAAAKEAAA